MHVMVMNFSHDEIMLPKGAVLGVAEETSAGIGAAINGEGTSNFRSTEKKHRGVKMAVNDTSLSPDVRESECANRLENLKSALKTAYKSVRENNYKFHVTNKRYFDRRAKERIFKPGELCICLAQPRNLDRAPSFGNHG